VQVGLLAYIRNNTQIVTQSCLGFGNGAFSLYVDCNMKIGPFNSIVK